MPQQEAKQQNRMAYAIGVLVIIVIVIIISLNSYRSYEASNKEGFATGYNTDRPTENLQKYIDRPPAIPESKNKPTVPLEPVSDRIKHVNWIEDNRGKYKGELSRGSEMEWNDRNQNSGIHVGAEAAATAEQELWTDATSDDSIQTFDTEQAFNSQQDAVRYHQKTPASYDEQLAKTVIGAREQHNHDQWYTSMTPWSGTATTVDTLDEAMEASINFVGLQRPQAVAQSNALLITEIDASHLIGNNVFRFTGEKSAHKRCE